MIININIFIFNLSILNINLIRNGLIIIIRKKVCSNCGKIISENKCDCKKEYKFKPKYDGDPILGTHRWKKKREYIRDRDGHMCQRCYIKYGIINTKDLSIHHIKSRKDYPELMWNDDNLICICKICNSQLGTQNKLDFEWHGAKDEDFNL